MKITMSTVITALLFLGISFLTILEGFRLKKGLSIVDYFQPFRPDNYLQILGVMMAFVTILFLVKEVFISKYDSIIRPQIRICHVGMPMIIFISYVASIRWLGYSLSTFLFYIIFLRWVGKYSYLKTVILSIIVTACYLIFVKTFYIIVPTGIVGI